MQGGYYPQKHHWGLGPLWLHQPRGKGRGHSSVAPTEVRATQCRVRGAAESREIARKPRAQRARGRQMGGDQTARPLLYRRAQLLAVRGRL